jgi:hypothetical protein
MQFLLPFLLGGLMVYLFTPKFDFLESKATKELKKENKQLEKSNKELNISIENRNKVIIERNKIIENQKTNILEKDSLLAVSDTNIANLEKEIEDIFNVIDSLDRQNQNLNDERIKKYRIIDNFTIYDQFRYFSELFRRRRLAEEESSRDTE